MSSEIPVPQGADLVNAPVAAVAPTAPAGKSAGTLLREARQAQGLELEAVAALLKVPVRKLEALEEDRYADLLGPTFVRALAQSACRIVKIDPVPVLAVLPSAAGDSLEQVSVGLNRSFQDPAYGRTWGMLLREQRGVLAVMLVFVVAALSLWLLPEGWLARVRAPQASASASAVEDAVPQAAPAPLAEPIASDRLPPPAASVPAGWPTPLAAALPASAAVAPRAPVPARAASTAPRAASWPARAASWVTRSASAAVRSASGLSHSTKAAATAAHEAAVYSSATPAAVPASGGQ